MTRAEDISQETGARTVSLRTARMTVIPLVPTDTPIPVHCAPRRLGSYDVMRELGRGGMGVVYEGFDSKLRRSVALKVLKQRGPTDDDLLRRFQTEAEAVARLQHPHIVHVIEVGVQDGEPFVALEYLSGGSLHQRIAGKPTPPVHAAELVRDLSGATGHAHDHGVLHRDLKPANVLFTADGIPKITDFGAARFDEANFGDGAGLTRAGEVIGTPQYMSPEQANGQSAHVGPAADVYSLGAMLYELLTGRPPFNGVEALDVIFAVRTQDPVPPRKLQPRIPRDLETICLKCLEKDPKRRYTSAVELQNDLSRFLLGDTIRARPAGPFRSTWSRAKRHPAGAGLIAGLIVAGLIGLTAFIVQYGKTINALVRANENQENLEKKTREAEQNLDRANEYASHLKVKSQEAEHNLDEANWNLYRGRINQAQLFLQQMKTDNAVARLNDTAAEKRDWEWSYLLQQSAHKLWEFEFPKDNFKEEAAWIYSQHLSPSGNVIAVAVSSPYDDDPNCHVLTPTTIGLFRVADGKRIQMIERALTTTVQFFLWLDDEQFIAADYYGSMFQWDVKSGRIVREWPCCIPGIFTSHIFANAAGTHIARTFESGQIEIIDPRDVRPTFTIATGFRSAYPCGLSPDASTVAVKCEFPDHETIRILDLATGRILHEWEGMNLGIGFAPDGRHIITTARSTDGHSFNCVITVRDTLTGKPIWTKQHRSLEEGSLIISPNGKRFAICHSYASEIHAYDLETGENHRSFPGHEGIIRGISFSPDGRWLVSCGDDRTIRIWDPEKGAEITRFSGHELPIRTITFGREGRWIISGGADERVICWDLAKSQASNGIMPALQSGSVGTQMASIVFNEKGNLGLVTAMNGYVEFNPSTNDPVVRRKLDQLNRRDAKEIIDYEFSADGSKFAGRSHEGNVVSIWETGSGNIIRTFDPKFKRLTAVAISRDGTRVAATGFDVDPSKKPRFRICVWGVADGKVVYELESHSPACGLKFSPDGRTLAVGYYRTQTRNGCAVTLVDLSGRTPIELEPLSQEPPLNPQFYTLVPCLEFSPDGKLLAGIDWGTSQLFLTDSASGKIDKKIQLTSPQTGLAFNPQGTRLAMTGYKDILTLFDTKHWNEVIQLKGAAGRPNDWAFPGRVAFSKDGRSLAATHWNGEFSIWHVESLEQNEFNPDRSRELSHQTAFQFHLRATEEAVLRNDPFAFRSHADRLVQLSPPTLALKQDWNELQEKTSPRQIASAVAGGITFDPLNNASQK